MITKLQQKWKSAAEDLGIEIVIPFRSSLSNGKEIRGEFLLPQFGRKKGMIITTKFEDIGVSREDLILEHYGYSVLREPRRIEEYNRSIFIEVLQDWGWSEENGSKPEWL